MIQICEIRNRSSDLTMGGVEHIATLVAEESKVQHLGSEVTRFKLELLQILNFLSSIVESHPIGVTLSVERTRSLGTQSR